MLENKLERKKKLTADEEVGGCAGEEDNTPSQGADQSTDAAEQQHDQAEGKQHHYCTVHAWGSNDRWFMEHQRARVGLYIKTFPTFLQTLK